MKLVLEHEKKEKFYSVTREATKFHQELGFNQTHHKETDSVTKSQRNQEFSEIARKGTDPNTLAAKAAAWSILEKSGETTLQPING